MKYILKEMKYLSALVFVILLYSCSSGRELGSVEF